MINPPGGCRVRPSAQVERVLINAIGSGPLQLLLAITAGKQSDTERSGALRGQQVPNAVPDHDRVVNGHPQPLGRGQEQVRIRLRVPHLIARDDRNFRRDVQGFQRGAGALWPPAGGDGIGDLRLRQVCQQLFGAGKRPHL